MLLFIKVLTAVSLIAVQCKGDSGKIIGGVDAPIEYYPWLISLQTKQSGHFCGASMISAKIALSAAHCLIRLDTELKLQNSFVLMNTSDLRIDGTKYNITKVLQHPNYIDRGILEFDFSLIFINTPPNFNPGRYARLPTEKDLKSNNPHEGDFCTVAGWGVTDSERCVSGGIVEIHVTWKPVKSPTLKHTRVAVMSVERCREIYIRDFRVTDDMICAASKGKDACQGDSGGPFDCKGVLAGIVSFGVGCGNERDPGIYARVTSAMPWIRSHL